MDRTIFEVMWYTRGENSDTDSPEWQERIGGFGVILGEDMEPRVGHLEEDGKGQRVAV